MNYRALIPCIYLKDQEAVKGSSGQRQEGQTADALLLSSQYENSGADALLIFDLSSEDEEHEKNLLLIKEICRRTDIPVIGAGNIKRMEDVKKLLYAGCKSAALDYTVEENIALTEEVCKKFGREKLAAIVDSAETLGENKELIQSCLSFAVLLREAELDACLALKAVPVLPLLSNTDTLDKILLRDGVYGAGGPAVNSLFSMRELKLSLREKGVPVNLLKSPLGWPDFKKGPDGLIPVIAQDYETGQVLMMAYMNEDAFQKTMDTGIMTYYSRSRNDLWVKGATSGHYQYLKSLWADCDRDTLLAKINQIGAACHTGSRTCFYEELVRTQYAEKNPMTVLEDVYGVIQDRRQNPREGSYTNYLFDKGIDKILKKLGEEAAEIIIAAKNPDPEEIKYEMSDFLYHAMVLMVQKGVTWEDILRELADR